MLRSGLLRILLGVLLRLFLIGLRLVARLACRLILGLVLRGFLSLLAGLLRGCGLLRSGSRSDCWCRLGGRGGSGSGSGSGCRRWCWSSNDFAFFVEGLALGGIAAAGDDLRAVVEVDVAEGIHPALGEHALSEDAPLTELLTPVRLAAHDDARRADAWDEDDTISLVDVDLPEVVGEVRIFAQGSHEVVDGARSHLEVYSTADDGEVSCEGGVHRDRTLALRDVVALTRGFLHDVEGVLLRQADLHGGGGGGDEGLSTLVDRHTE